MSKKDIENLVKVKKELAAKYERLAATRHSTPRKASMMRRVEFYRQQVQNLERQIK